MWRSTSVLDLRREPKILLVAETSIVLDSEYVESI